MKFAEDDFLSQSGSHTSKGGYMNEWCYFLFIDAEKVIISYTLFSAVNISRIALNSVWFHIQVLGDIHCTFIARYLLIFLFLSSELNVLEVLKFSVKLL